MRMSVCAELADIEYDRYRVFPGSLRVRSWNDMTYRTFSTRARAVNFEPGLDKLLNWPCW